MGLGARARGSGFGLGLGVGLHPAAAPRVLRSQTSTQPRCLATRCVATHPPQARSYPPTPGASTCWARRTRACRPISPHISLYLPYISLTRCVYVLGAEDQGLPPAVVRACTHCVSLECSREARCISPISPCISLYLAYISLYLPYISRARGGGGARHARSRPSWPRAGSRLGVGVRLSLG